MSKKTTVAGEVNKKTEGPEKGKNFLMQKECVLLEKRTASGEENSYSRNFRSSEKQGHTV